MINLKVYDISDDYKNKKIKMTWDMDISKSDLKRYAISLGNYSSYKISKKGEKFYHYLLEMSLEEYVSGRMKYFKIGEDYKNAESSIKNTISFFVGMIAAKAVAEKKYKVPLLYHLTDQIIISTPVVTQTTVATSSQAGAKKEEKIHFLIFLEQIIMVRESYLRQKEQFQQGQEKQRLITQKSKLRMLVVWH